MTVVARRLASIPVRLASDTWHQFTKLVAPSNTAAQEELRRVTGIAASLITREAMKDSPIVATGDGPRVRVYCLYGDKAIEGTSLNEAPLPKSPVETSTWAVSLPCPADDLPWVTANLEQHSPRITARDMAESAPPEAEVAASGAKARINLESFLR